MATIMTHTAELKRNDAAALGLIAERGVLYETMQSRPGSSTPEEWDRLHRIDTLLSAWSAGQDMLVARLEADADPGVSTFATSTTTTSAALFYCPYIPLQLGDKPIVDTEEARLARHFNPTINMKTRYSK
jgi:hypothetical protein